MARVLTVWMLLKHFFHPVCREGYPFIAGFGLGALLLSALNWGLGLVFFLLALGCCYFFRDPVRVVPMGDDIIISPADGVVAQVSRNVDFPGNSGEGGFTRVVIFLSVMNVHINRYPVSGVLESIDSYEGKCSIPALRSNCGESRRQEFFIRSKEGKKFAVVQVSGMVARRLVAYGSQDQEVSRGGKLGIIKFGSRVDLYFPSDASVIINAGQTVVGGESIIALFDTSDFVERSFEEI